MSSHHQFEDVPLRERIAANSRPAVVWVVGLAVLLLVELGALLSALFGILELVASVAIGALHGAPSGIGPNSNELGASVVWAMDAVERFGDSLPTLLSRNLIPNQGHQVPAGGWEGTFLGLPPAFAWFFRVVLVYGYLFLLLWWVWFGYRTFVEHYRQADWTPRDDVVRRLRGHRWGQFGFVIVILFVGLALFAPTLSPVTYEHDVQDSTSYQVEYLSEETGQVETTTAFDANLASASQGDTRAVGPLSYDDYGRFHPFGTLNNPGGDLFTFMAYGARVSLFIGLLAIAISGFIATFFGLVTAYYKGIADLGVVVVSDSIQAIPVFLLLIIVNIVFQNHWLSSFYNGALLIGVTFGLLYWPGLWRSVRGPAFQVAEQEWVDAARSYGQRSTTTMRKHMLPYIMGYLLIYGSLTIGGIIITTSALSFLGIGITPPTPEWGRVVANGRNYVTTASWHVAFIPGVLIVLVVTAFNAMGDGIRDAIDPQSDAGESGASEAAAAGGGG